jgi:hypothetical protein
MRMRQVRSGKPGRKHQNQFPLATVAFYGPDDTRATKVVVAIFKSEDSEPDPMRRWTCGEGDIREDREITAKVREFVERFAPIRVVAAERILGCPHEEGTDYPTGESCPHCPFWSMGGGTPGETIH